MQNQYLGGEVNRLILGEVEELWDIVAVVRYPSRKAMFKMATSEDYIESEKHRKAGLAGQLNIEVIANGWNFEFFKVLTMIFEVIRLRYGGL